MWTLIFAVGSVALGMQMDTLRFDTEVDCITAKEVIEAGMPADAVCVYGAVRE